MAHSLRPLSGRLLGRLVVAGAVLVTCIVIWRTNHRPRTDDATVRANLVQIAPDVAGRVVLLPIRDNSFVKKGDLLFEIDRRSYEHALQAAESDQAALEQQIVDQARHIAAETSAARAATADATHSSTSVRTATSAVDVQTAAIARAQAAVDAATAHLQLAQNDLHRIAPLLPKGYVTVQEADEVNTKLRVAQGEFDQALAGLSQAKKQELESRLKEQESEATAAASQARVEQAAHNVDTTDTLESERLGRKARVEEARVNLERTRVVAPFDAWVTNLNVSEGAYAHAGTPLFTLIDTRVWYVLANYRESALERIPVGAKVDVYLMSHPERRFEGVVESIGHGVVPEDGLTKDGLPDVSRTLNWVHLASRFPVRIRILAPDPEIVRIGETAVTTVR